MPGSSRSLLRALYSVFETWDASLDWQKEPSSEIKALYGTIYAYTERHNTMATVSGVANSEMRETHEKFVKTAGDISREVFFLELLSRLLPVLSASEVRLWLRTYLRPAVDSAGFDLSFVEKARGFINLVTLEVFPSEDSALMLRRSAIANMVMDYLVQIYIGGDPSAYELIEMKVLDLERDTQIHVERLRFIEKNAHSLLKEWGLKNPYDFFMLLHKYYQNPVKRFKVLDLAAKLVSSNVSQLQKILDTPFFLDLLRSLILDCSEAILGSCLSTVLMVLGKICHRVSAYLPEFLLVYTRLLLWKDHGPMLSARRVAEISWNIAESDLNTLIMQTQVFVDGQFNLLYFTTLLYGLFPLNLLAFCKSPDEYLLRNPPKMMVPETKIILGCISREEDLENMLFAKSNTTLTRLMLHPNILNNITLKEEIQSPMKWILSKNEGLDVGEEEVLLECLGLNPDIIFTIPENIVLPEQVLKRIQSFSSLTTDASDLRFLHRFSTATQIHDNSLPPSQRGSFQMPNEAVGSSNITAESKIPSHWLNMDRRVSIVPTRLVLENNLPQLPLQLQLQQESGGIIFKPVDFDGSSSVISDTTVKSEKPVEIKKKDYLSDLYTVHEKLFTSSATVTANQLTVNTDTAHSTKGHFQGSVSTASDILSRQLQSEGKEVQPEIKDAQYAGRALDFYQRELLLMKNELEFSSYMKHLNKINYVKLTLKFNRYLRDQNNGAPKDINMAGTSLSQHEYETLIESLRELKEASEAEIAAKLSENEALLLRTQTLENELATLERDSEKSELIIAEKVLLVERLKTELDRKMDTIRDLQAKIHDFEEIQAKLAIKSKPQEVKSVEPLMFLDEQEKAVADLKMHLGSLKTENSILSSRIEETLSELEQHERKLKVHFTDKSRELEEIYRSKEIQYERKLKELDALKLRYEQVIEEQSAQIAHLSKAKPIHIPRMGQKQTSPAFEVGTRPSSAGPKFLLDRDGEYFSRDPSTPVIHEHFGKASHRGLPMPSLESASLNFTAPDLHVGDPYFKGIRVNEPPRVQSNTSIPIIRGRGGYQKRSKKIM